jgi:hypothetical protein
MINKFKFGSISFLLILSLLSLNSYPLDSVKTKNKVIEVCKEYDGNELKFLQRMSKEILPDPKLRDDLIRNLKAENIPGCKNALSDYIKGILKNKDKKYRRGMQAYLSLALVANIPEARQLIESEIDDGTLSDFIDVLKETDENVYYRALGKWVEKVSTEVRKAAHADLQPEDKYGRVQQTDHSEQGLSTISIWSPLFMNRYLAEAIHRKEKLTKKEFSDLNIIFASANGSYRGVFYDPFVTLVKSNTQQWIYSFRIEQAWVQFRLFPILKQPGNGPMKRELIWLAEYHQDGRIRLLAQNALDGGV